MRMQTTPTSAAVGAGTSGEARLVWPDAVAFREAVQNPGVALGDPELRNADVVQDKRGLPVAYSGRFAVVFRLRTLRGEDWALRCFTQGTNDAERRLRYTAIARRLESLPAHFVPFRYVEQGIRVGFQWYPVVAMRWANGETLGRFVEKNLHRPEALRALCLALSDLLARLEAAGIAHGDWQHDNLLVSDSGRMVTLVDYDGMYVPELDGRVSPELGHHNYQHFARHAGDFGVGMDRFSHLILQTALLALCKDPTLWTRFNDGESMLFKKADFLNPSRSLVFRAIANVCGPGDTLLHESLMKLQAACLAGRAGVIPDAGTLPASYPALKTINGIAPPPPSSFPQPWTTFVPPGKWWMGDGGQQQVAATNGSSASVAAALAQQQTILDEHEAYLDAGAGYISRLVETEAQVSERKNLWWTRAAWAVCLALFAFFLVAEGRFSTFPWIVLFQLVFLPYNAWPTKKVSDELKGEIKKLETLLGERVVKVAEKRASAPSLFGPNASDVAAYVSGKLRQVPIAGVLAIPGIGLHTLQLLRAAGVNAAADLQNQASVPGVTTHEMAALQNWCREQEMLAADQYRQSASTQQQVSKEVTRLEHEIAGLEAELDKLRLEREQFPDASAVAFFKKVLGVRS